MLIVTLLMLFTFLEPARSIHPCELTPEKPPPSCTDLHPAYPELEHCRCHETVINCEFAGFGNIPDIPKNTTELIMRGNNITSLSTIPEYPSMTMLDLSENGMKTLQADAFSKVTNVTKLYLGNNDLNFTQIPRYIFDPMSNLQVLDISLNYMWFTTSRYRGDLVANMASVKNLSMDGLRRQIFGSEFSGLTSLEALTFLPSMISLRNHTFYAFRKSPIKILRIWSGVLKRVEPDTFAHFPKLEVLDLSYNVKLGFYGAAEAWHGLQYTNIQSLIMLHAADFSFDIITLNETFFIGLEKTNITNVNLDGNQIKLMDGLFHKYVPNLKHFSFSYNQLTQVTSVIVDIAKMQNLITVDASHQIMRHNQTEREILDRSGAVRLLEMLVDRIMNRTSRDEIDENESQTHIFSDELSEDCPGIWDFGNQTSPMPFPLGVYLPLVAPKTMTHMNLSASLSIEVDALPQICIFNAISFKYLDYSNNGVKHIDQKLVMVNESMYNITLNLRHNKIMSVGPYFTKKGTILGKQVEALLVRDNDLGALLREKGTKIISGLENVKILEVSYNSIKYLPYDAFSTHPRLQHLDLEENMLRDIHFDLCSLRDLETLNVRNNLLTMLTESERDSLDCLVQARKVSDVNSTTELDLVGNPLICSCESLDFLQWTFFHQRNPRSGLNITDFSSLCCTYGETYKSFDELQVVIDELKRKCNIGTYLMVTFIPTAVIALVVALSIFAHRHRWDIKFWFLNMSIRRKKEQAFDESHLYQYDVFVVYSDSSLQFITRNLIPNLEKEGGMSLIIHDRDFIPGNAVDENIIQSIKSSRKTLLVIDRDFVMSNWCKFETHMAHHEAISRGRDIIIAVLLEPAAVLMENTAMYQSLKSLLKKRTYIEWPRNPALQEEFWQRLLRAIKDPIMRPLQCVCGRALGRQENKDDAEY